MLLLLTAECTCDSDSKSLTASDGQVNRRDLFMSMVGGRAIL